MVAVRAENPELYIGIMSGTSLDGVDLSLVSITPSENQPSCPDIQSLANRFTDFPTHLRNTLSDLSFSKTMDAITLGQVSVELAKLFATEVKELLNECHIESGQITAIGCHGITVRHYPEIENGFSLQITDGNTLAQLTGIDVVTDFRGMDIAAGGQGAPLVPPFHQALFAANSSLDSSIENQKKFVVLNLGGIANISVIRPEQEVIGFDTGPANTLLDQWCLEHTGQTYDKDGEWAAKGNCNKALLSTLLSESYFSRSYPKSTGKELFNISWLTDILSWQEIDLNDEKTVQDIQTTLTHLTALSIAQQVEPFGVDQLIVCGGGAENSFLMSLLSEYLPDLNVKKSSNLSSDNLAPNSFDPNAIEAMAFAWLAYCRIHNLSANSPSVTGASKNVVMGAWYSAHSFEPKTLGEGTV